MTVTDFDEQQLRELERRRATGPVDVNRKDAVRLALAWARDGRPGAIVRFGEGEGRLLFANPDDEESMIVARRKIRRQTGRKVSHGDVLRIKERVDEAFDRADVVGIRGSASFDEEHRMWVARIERVFEERLAEGRPPAFVTHSLVNNDLRDALEDLIGGRRYVTVISCRDVEGLIRERYGVQDVRVHQVPSQYRVRGVDGEYEARLHDVPIWPRFHSRLREELEVREPGEIFLIGAGLFGKDLCVRVRDLGGIALDLGSTLDGLAGKVTRGAGRPEPYRPPAPSRLPRRGGGGSR